MKIMKIRGIVDNLTESYFFTRELDIYDYENDKKFKLEATQRQMLLKEKVDKLTAKEQKEREKLENERKRRESRRSSVSDSSEAPEKSKKRKRVTKKEDTASPKPATPKTVAYKPKPLEQCEFSGCDEYAMPLTKFCFCHILNDEKQLLFVKCQYESPGGKACSYPILKYSEPAICHGHLELSSKSSETATPDTQKKRKDKVKKQEKKDAPYGSFVGMDNSMSISSDDSDPMKTHQSMFVIHNEAQQPAPPPTGGFPSYIVHPPHPIIPFNGMVPNAQGNFIHYNTPPNPNNVGFFNYHPHQQG